MIKSSRWEAMFFTRFPVTRRIVALIGGLFVFIVPASAWLTRKNDLDNGFAVAFVLASAGIYAMLYGRVRWVEATVLGNLLLVFGAVFLVLSSMRDLLLAAEKQSLSRSLVIQISGAALFFTCLRTATELNWFRLESATELPLLGLFAATIAAYWSSKHWAMYEFASREWPILPLAALLPIGVMLGKTWFGERLETGEVLCVGLVTIIVSTTHWLRRWSTS